jgi:hypothetical protein
MLTALAKRGRVVHFSGKARKVNHKLFYICERSEQLRTNLGFVRKF